MKVGDYVRTLDGYIDKTTDIRLQTKYTKYNTLYFENKIGEKLFTDEELKEMKSSSNIIDLIEIGDYVNGYEVTSKDQFLGFGNHDWYMTNDEIKSIVTHEQFSQMEYRIGE